MGGRAMPYNVTHEVTLDAYHRRSAIFPAAPRAGRRPGAGPAGAQSGRPALAQRRFCPRPRQRGPAHPAPRKLARERVGIGRRRRTPLCRRRHAGLRPRSRGDSWLIVHPCHIEIARTHLLMTDLRRLGLVESHARALFDSAKPYFDEDGHTLLYGDASTWFMRAGDWAQLLTTSPDTTGGMNLTDCLPQGAQALAYRKLQNEVQMLWHAHPANAEREARGLPAINGFWPWAGAPANAQPQAAIASANAPAWLAALGETLHGHVGDWLARTQRPAILVEA